MGKAVLIFLLGVQCIAAEVEALKICTVCHETAAPPFSLVYRRYLMLYSSKARIEKRMVNFLTAPSKKRSSMPEGMKNRFNPQEHPAFDAQTVHKAVKALIRKEDLIPKIVVSTSVKK
jgi:hypothetical protein